MRVINYFVLIIWIIFWLYWLISASKSKRNISSNINKFVGVRLGVFVLILILIHFSFFRRHIFNNNLNSADNSILLSAGLILLISGLLFAIWARVNLGRNWGMPMSLKKNPELVITGPYHYVRHPIYTGILAAMLGTSLVIGISWILILFVLGAYFIFSANVEEKNMTKIFPKDYPKYKQTTKMIIPFIF
jgi:protein-S-isoprenylcysteine O-methyltransferase Ste14